MSYRILVIWLEYLKQSREFNFSNGKIARLADGSVLVRAGGSAVLVTAVSEGVIDESFFGAPLKASMCIKLMTNTLTDAHCR